VNSNYSIETIITEQDRKELKKLFDNLSFMNLQQGCHLFNIERRDVKDEKNVYTEKIRKYGESKGYQLQQNYFLKYRENSFTRVHADDCHSDSVKLTIVTVVETQDLIGGECLVFDEYQKTLDNRGDYIMLSGDDNGVPYGKNIIPVFVKLNCGQSVVYDGGVEHGVTRVEQGHRVVLVSWFN